MKRLALLIVVAALTACSSIHVATDHDAKADFSRLHAYAWAPREKPANPIVENTLVSNRIKDAVDRELAAKGFRRVDGRGADFLVDFATSARSHVDVRTWPTWCWGRVGRGFGGWHDRVEVIQYVQGTLVVGVVDPATNDLLWRGTATRALDEDSGSEKRVDEAVKAVLAEFPPTK